MEWAKSTPPKAATSNKFSLLFSEQGERQKHAAEGGDVQQIFLAF
jgi:hypothetical protein